MKKNKLTRSIKIRIIVLSILLFLLTIIGITYAYFTIQVTGNEEASSIRVSTARLSLIYTDTLLLGGDRIKPQWTQSKTISVKNNGTVPVYYNIIWRDLLNEITDDELVISGTCSTNASGRTCDNISETIIPVSTTETHNISIKNNIEIAVGETHTYTVTVVFKETGSNQNYNQNKEFYGTINIAEGSNNQSLTTTSPELFEYTINNNEVTITGFNGIYNATYDINQSTCETYFSEFGENFSAVAEEFCSGTGVDPDDGKTLDYWVAYNWILEDEYESFGLSNVNITGRDIVIPTTIEGKPVVAIGLEAFLEKSLTSVVIPNSVRTIDENAFMYNYLSSVTIPNSVESIGNYAFSNNLLTSVTIKEKLSSSDFELYGTGLWGWTDGYNDSNNIVWEGLGN